jgi:hypothetical protein
MNLAGLDLEEEDITLLNSCLTHLQKRYTVEVLDYVQIPNLLDLTSVLKSYQILSHWKNLEIINIFQIRVGEEVFQIINVFISYLVNIGRGQLRELTDVQSIGWAELPVDLGHVLITPETITDKVIDIFLHRDVDFEASKEFSNRFLLQTSNKIAARHYFKTEWLNSIAKLKHVEIEITGNKLIARFPKNTTKTDSMAIARLLETAKETIK